MIANQGLRSFEQSAIDFPKCLELDARGRFIDKNKLQTKTREDKIRGRKVN